LLLLACLGAAFAYAVGGVLSKKISPVAVISWTLIFCLPLNLIICFFTYQANLSSIPLNAWMAFLWLSMSSSFVGFFFWYGGLALGGTVRVSQLLLLQPIFTLLFSSVLLDDQLTMINLVFTALIIATVVLGRKQAIAKA
jgi:drug/metabolite transporter (DMT)-like permease